MYQDREQARAHLKSCIREQAAYCTAACPFGLDLRSFSHKLAAGRWNAAYREYANTVVFPGIVAALCPEYCRGACPRAESGGAVQVRLLEDAACRYASNTKPNSYNLPPKEQRVAIVGAGGSGLACCLVLANRKYPVTVFEQSGRIGGRLRDLLPEARLLGEINKEFANESYELKLNTFVADPASLLSQGYDAVYIATGEQGADSPDQPGVFRGGGLLGADPVMGIAQGVKAANRLEAYLRTKLMKEELPPCNPSYALDPLTKVEPVPAVLPENGQFYTKDEAAAEAKRCLRCRCDACVRHCAMMRHFEKTPRRIEDEVEVTVNPGTLDGDGTVATRLISTCNQCGLCQEVCPSAIDTGGFLNLSHQAMVARAGMPWPFHEFYLRDMQAMNSDYRLALLPENQAGYVYFPGCACISSTPDYVIQPYAYLQEQRPGIGLLLSCCGAPAAWAARADLHEQALAQIRAYWQEADRPVFILACPSCQLMFQRYLPEIPVASLYTHLAELGLTPEAAAGGKVSVFDPCAARHDAGAQSAVRALTEAAGYRLEPLPYEGQYAQCCSYGGQIDLTNPPYAAWLSRERAFAGPEPYVCYCANCRDTFAKQDKPARHVLDLLFNQDGWQRPAPRLDQRLANRRLVKAYYGGEVAEVKGPELLISGDLLQKLDKAHLLVADLRAVIQDAEASKRYFSKPAQNSRLAHGPAGQATVWVEYQALDSGFELLNAYSHRMKIESEAADE
mgnify:CR=1 FL=1